MPSPLRIAIAALSLANASIGSAEEPTPPLIFGASASVVPTASGTFDRGGVGLWLRIDRERLRIEPSVSFSMRSSELGGVTTTTRDSVDVGVALLREITHGERSTIHAGGTVGVSAVRSVWNGSGLWTASARVAAAMRGEYFLAPVFSLGVSADVGFSGSGVGGWSQRSFRLQTSGALLASYHFR